MSLPAEDTATYELPESFGGEDQIIDYLAGEELANLSAVDLQEEIHVLDEHPSLNTATASSSSVPVTSAVPCPRPPKPSESSVLRSPTGGGDLIYLQKLKKVKKPKGSKSKGSVAGSQRSVKEFFFVKKDELD